MAIHGNIHTATLTETHGVVIIVLEHTLQHTATRCNTRQHAATHTEVNKNLVIVLKHILEHIATRCNTLQHAAPHTAAHTEAHALLVVG